MKQYDDFKCILLLSSFRRAHLGTQPQGCVFTHTQWPTHTQLLNGIHLTAWRAIVKQMTDTIIHDSVTRAHDTITHTRTHREHTHTHKTIQWFINHLIPSIHLSAEGEGQLDEEEDRRRRGTKEKDDPGQKKTWEREAENYRENQMLL